MRTEAKDCKTSTLDGSACIARFKRDSQFRSASSSILCRRMSRDRLDTGGNAHHRSVNQISVIATNAFAIVCLVWDAVWVLESFFSCS